MIGDDMAVSADDELPAPSTSSQSNGDQQPKKGILKRPSIINEEKRDKLFPLAGFRSSPDRYPEKGPSRIPKLQVTWWEKNAVAFIGETSDENNTDSEQIMRDLGSGQREQGPKPLQIRQTAILDSEDSDLNESDILNKIPPMDLDETMSITSSTGSATSAVVGKWWTGKDTRYVPHCVKKGCNHANHAPPGEYITPTQRRNRELAQLKKELRQALSERDEKDKHLSDLRDKVKEIEVFNEAQNTLLEGHKMMRMEQIEKETLEREKKIMEKKHAVRVNQLIQETMSAREETVRLTSRNAYLEELLNVKKSDCETQTEIESNDREVSMRTNPPDPFDPNAAQSSLSKSELASPTSPKIPFLQEMQSSPTGSLIIPLISNDSKSPIYCSQEALNHIQACQNEAFIWRNKAAQLEIVAKEQLLRIGQLEEELEKSSKFHPPHSSVENIMAMSITENSVIIKDCSNTEVTNKDALVADCTSSTCLETKNNMKNEIENLRQTLSEGKQRVSELEEDVTALRKDLEKLDEENNRLGSALQSANLEIKTKTAEIVASLGTANRLQNEKENMNRAIDYMEERMQAYRNALQENNLILSDENNSEWRKTTLDPRYIVMHSKTCQTTLTSQKLAEHESEFLNTQRTLQDLQKEFNVKNSNLADKFKEIEDILLTKTELVEALSKQLEDVRKNQTMELKLKQNERDQYKKSLEEVTLVAEKVPLLETQVANLAKEKNQIESEYKHHLESYEDEISRLLEESLNKNKKEAVYFEEKVRGNEKLITKLQAENAKLVKDLEEQKIKTNLQKAELQKKLISSIEHVGELQGKVNKSQRDVECQAIPRQINKYVGCKPNVKSKETMVEKGSLFDENEERLRICKTELETTRRQVTVLQQKLVSFIQQQTSQKVKKRIAVVEETKSNKEMKESIESKMKEVELKNIELIEKINTLEAEKFVASSLEKSRIQKLVNEFDNLREKLDQDMNNYSKEKQWLQWRISNLEKDNSELQKIADQNNLGHEKSSEVQQVVLRKTMSEPEFGDDISLSTEDNITSTTEAEQTVENVTAPPLSIHSLRPFSQLADVLNLVRSDLEQVLTEIEEPETDKTSEKLNKSDYPIDQSTDILNNVLNEWAEDERRTLERQLKRSQEERSVLKETNNQLSKDLNVAMAELNVYKSEKPHKVDEPTILERSSSFTNIGENGFAKDTQRWKEKSGILFREVNRIRQQLTEVLQFNAELRYQLALAKGERELSSCFEKEAQYPISPSLSYHTAADGSRFKEKDDIVIHETDEPFQLGSSKASLSCSIMIRSQSAERKSHSKESGRRSRSANRKPPVSKDELSKREKRREMRLPKNVSRSSSATSMYVTSKEQQKTPLMSASWHEKAIISDLPDGDTDYDRRNIRVISLREKIGKLTRENKELHAKLQYLNTGNSDQSKMLMLEKETEELKSTVKELLRKVSTASSTNDREFRLLQDELKIRRQESAMYEKKLAEVEEERKEMYLLMFKKGQQAASLELKEDKIMDAMTEDRITLKFLHDAFYYYLLNRGDSQEHLSVMMTILGFTAAQKAEIANRKRGRSN